jgi:hypothetical protein
MLRRGSDAWPAFVAWLDSWGLASRRKHVVMLRMALALCVASVLSDAQVIESATGGFDEGGFAGRYRYLFIAERGVSSSQLAIRETRRLRASGWRLVRTEGKGGVASRIGSPGSVSEFESPGAELHVSIALVDGLGDAQDQSAGAMRLSRAAERAVAHKGVLFATLRSVELP